jgi:hypothetical protein
MFLFRCMLQHRPDTGDDHLRQRQRGRASPPVRGHGFRSPSAQSAEQGGQPVGGQSVVLHAHHRQFRLRLTDASAAAADGHEQVGYRC